MTYNLHEHRHRFSVWAAARAAQRGCKGAKVERLRDALEACGVKEFARFEVFPTTSAEEFEKCHRGWCRSVIDFLRDHHSVDFSYGRAAKLIAIYLKSMVIVGPSFQISAARIIHPPIDSILLNGICNSRDPSATLEKKWKSKKWTKLGEKQYYELVDALRQLLHADEGFWMLERFWTVVEERKSHTE